MAAHSIRILIEMYNELPARAEQVEPYVERYRHALDYAPGMGELYYDGYAMLRRTLATLEEWSGAEGASKIMSLEMRDKAQTTILTALYVQMMKWKAYSRPTNHEEWMDNKAKQWIRRER
jgi:hypothetical protein